MTTRPEADASAEAAKSATSALPCSAPSITESSTSAPPITTLHVDALHIDADIIVFNKPAGLLSVPGRGPDKQDCLSARAQQNWPEALVVHRLDMATSGLVVMARNLAAQRALSRNFAERKIYKRYIAVVHGQLHLPHFLQLANLQDPQKPQALAELQLNLQQPPQPRAGSNQVDQATAAGSANFGKPVDAANWAEINLPIAVDWPRRPLRKIDALLGKASITRWQPLAHDLQTNTTRLALEPITGRTHQLRLHLQALGHAILGDMLYADAQVQARSPRLLLHACELAFAHPINSTILRFDCPAPF